MQSIYKYQLETTAAQVLKMPTGAKILSVQIQLGLITIWALIDLYSKDILEERVFLIYNTGTEHQAVRGKHLATVQELDGQVIYHVFELEGV